MSVTRSAASDPVQVVIDALRQRGCDPSATGPDKFESRCPSHNGSRPNLSICKGQDGRVLLHCHHIDDAGRECGSEAIVTSLGLTLGDLFPQDLKPMGSTANGTGPKGANTKRGFETPKAAAEFLAKKLDCKSAKSWCYLNGLKEPAMIVYRFDPPGKTKEYRPVHPTKDGWKFGDPPGPLPMYRLPEVAGAARVYIHEGEKAADAAQAIGLVASTSSHGANSPQKTDWTPLAGKEVIISPDNDPEGEGYAQAVVNLLARLEPKPTVKILRLPNLPEKGDAVEWIANLPQEWGPEEARAELERLADATSPEDLSAAGQPPHHPNGQVRTSRTPKPSATPEPLDTDAVLARIRPIVEGGDPSKLFVEPGLLPDLARLRVESPTKFALVKIEVAKLKSKGLSLRDFTSALNEHAPQATQGRGQVDAATAEFSFSDLGNAGRFLKLHKDRVRYCALQKCFYMFDGTRWARDESCAIEDLAKQIAAEVLMEIPPTKDQELIQAFRDWSLTSESRSRIDDALKLARSDRSIAVTPKEFDRDPWAFNVKNGTINLRTGLLRPHDRRDLISKLAGVAFEAGAKCPKFEAFILRIAGGDADLTGYLQRVAGYAMTARVSEQCMFMLYGEGANGKTTFLKVIQSICGEYATTISPELLVSKRTEDHPTGLTDLDGTRFVPTVEIDGDKKLAEALLKRLTGGDPIKARRMHENFYEFMPMFKLFLAANHKPEIRGDDHGIWRRIKLIPFIVTIPAAEQVDDYDEALFSEEGPGILNWMIAGCLEWQRRKGLDDPKAVTEATAEYQDEMDIIKRFIEERCIEKPDTSCPIDRLFKSFNDWCESSKVRVVMTANKFSRRLGKKGFEVRHENGGNVRVGIDLRDSPESWLLTYLKGNPSRVSDVYTAAEKAGLVTLAIFRASQDIKVNEWLIDGKKHWALPSEERGEGETVPPAADPGLVAEEPGDDDPPF